MRTKDNASRKRRGWEGQARTIGDESTERRRRRRRRRRTQVSQAVITDIGSAIVGATKAHVPKRTRMNDGKERLRGQRRGGAREEERKTSGGVKGDCEYGAIHRQSHARSLPTSTRLPFSFSFFFFFFSFSLSPSYTNVGRYGRPYHHHTRRQI